MRPRPLPAAPARYFLLLLMCAVWPCPASADVPAQPVAAGVSRVEQVTSIAVDAQLGRPARAVTVSARATTQAAGGAWELFVDERMVAPLPFAPSALTAQAVALSGGTVALVQADGGPRTYALLLARRGTRVVVLDAGRTDLTGDPGERRAHLLTVVTTDTDNGASLQVVRGTVAERVSVCGADVTWLDTQTLDARALTFSAAAVQPPGQRQPSQTRAAQPADASLQPPRLDALRFDVASSGGGEASFERAPRPLALTDQDDSTAWVEAEATRGQVAFATGRFDASEWPVRRLSLVPLPAAAAATVRAPEYVDVASQDTLVRVTLPADVRAGQRYVVDLDPPVSFRCVSVLLPTPSSAHTHVGLAEFTLHSEFDAADGPQRLLSELARGGSRAVSASRLLRGLGSDGAVAIAGAWPDMTARERRLALRALSDMAAAQPEARAALLVAGRDADPELRLAALDALRGAGAGNELTTLMNEGDDDAAQVLARAIPGRALQVLLPALTAEGGVVRVGLRAAILEALMRAPVDAVAVTEAWAGEERSVEASALVAQALGGSGEAAAALGTQLLRSAAPRAQSFEDVWRVTVAAASLPADPTLDAWLSARVSTDERWMVRAEAAASLAARSSPLSGEATLTLAADDFPRARERATGLLRAADPAERGVLLQLAQRDAWPRVRAAAVLTLGASPEARALLVGALSDPKARVRLAAVEAFRTAGDDQAAAAIAARLARPNELATVHRAAARYLGQVCSQAHVETLIEAVARGRRPNAYEPDIETAVVAVAALSRLGGARVSEYLSTLRDGGPPEAVRAAAARGLQALGACQGDAPAP